MGIKKKKNQEIHNIDGLFCETCGREKDQTCNCGKTKYKTSEELNETAKYWQNLNKKN